MIRCECGVVTGVRCGWVGQRRETQTVDWMPVYLRASHEAAGGCGTYPANGAVRLSLAPECAEQIMESESGWAVWS